LSGDEADDVFSILVEADDQDGVIELEDGVGLGDEGLAVALEGEDEASGG
jgi:hypothetical protein